MKTLITILVLIFGLNSGVFAKSKVSKKKSSRTIASQDHHGHKKHNKEHGKKGKHNKKKHK